MTAAEVRLHEIIKAIVEPLFPADSMPANYKMAYDRIKKAFQQERERALDEVIQIAKEQAQKFGHSETSQIYRLIEERINSLK